MITDRDVATGSSKPDSHPFYTQFLASFGVKWFAGMTISPDEGVWVGLSLQRLIDKQPYSDEELERFTIVGRHVENALRAGLRHINAEVVAAHAHRSVRRGFDIVMFLVDASQPC